MATERPSDTGGRDRLPEPVDVHIAVESALSRHPEQSKRYRSSVAALCALLLQCCWSNTVIVPAYGVGRRGDDPFTSQVYRTGDGWDGVGGRHADSRRYTPHRCWISQPMHAIAKPTYTSEATTVKNVCTGPGRADLGRYLKFTYSSSGT